MHVNIVHSMVSGEYFGKSVLDGKKKIRVTWFNTNNAFKCLIHTVHTT